MNHWRTRPLARRIRLFSRLCSVIRRSGLDRVLWLVGYIEEVQGGQRSRDYRLPVNRAGDALPWYTYPAIEFLEQLDFSGCDVFEYGSGNGSRYWATKARNVISVESDLEWYQKGIFDISANRKLLLKTDKAEYLRVINDNHSQFDVIIIDGKYRYDCAREAVPRLKAGGFIVLDNSDWFPKTAQLLRQAGLIQIDFIGNGPINSYAWATSLFFRGVLIPARGGDVVSVRVNGGLEQVCESNRPE